MSWTLLVITWVAIIGWVLYVFMRNVTFTKIAREHVQSLQADVEVGFGATMSNYGAIYVPKYCTSTRDTIVINVHAAYCRGGYSEHDRVYVVQVDRQEKTVVQCDGIDVVQVSSES